MRIIDATGWSRTWMTQGFECKLCTTQYIFSSHLEKIVRSLVTATNKYRIPFEIAPTNRTFSRLVDQTIAILSMNKLLETNERVKKQIWHNLKVGKTIETTAIFHVDNFENMLVDCEIFVK